VVFYGQEHAIDVLTTEKVKYMDWDLINPHLIVLDIFASWGLLTFEYNEVEENNILYVYIDVEHDPICKKIADVIKTRIDANNKS
ncbi:MAG TPA: hypothetical protein VLA72_18550, partial [Anaerolineales bacterium]|nr:hypothetical protein [Anaerolineales bacterium]